MRGPDDLAIDQIVASCNGDIRGALKALLLVNEQLEAELRQLYAATEHGGKIASGRNKAVRDERASVLH
jgi:hypothetical protein